MMKYLNALVFSGLIASSLTPLIGTIFGDSNPESLAAYFGWLLCAYSGVTFLVMSAIDPQRRGKSFSKTFYPINFGLALVAISVIGTHNEPTAIIMGATAVVAVPISIMLSRSDFLDRKFVLLVLLLVLGTVLAEPIFAIWKYLAVFIGMLLLVNAFLRSA
jgi:hypothetical protein